MLAKEGRLQSIFIIYLGVSSDWLLPDLCPMARANLALSRMAIVSPPPDLLRPNPGFRNRGDCRFLSVAYPTPTRRWDQVFFSIFLPRTDRVEAPHRRKRSLSLSLSLRAMHVADFR